MGKQVVDGPMQPIKDSEGNITGFIPYDNSSGATKPEDQVTMNEADSLRKIRNAES